MGIKDDADRVYFAHHPEQRDLAAALDEAFNVTFAKSHGDLAMWLAEPKGFAKHRFGLDQEVLVIYSPHPKTDARVLTAVENISRIPEFRHRIEKVLAILIHQGDPEETANLLNANRDWVIAPFQANELLNPARGSLFVRSRIAETLGKMDLFGISSPITSDKYFFGRDELVHNLVTRSITRHESSGLFGLRKTGKTSVLFAVQRRLSDQPVLAEYIDCQNPGIHAARWWQVLEEVSRRCSTRLHRERKRKARVVLGYTQTNAGSRFAQDIKQTIADGRLSRMLVMFDEIEYMTPGISGSLGQHWDSDFLPFWQAIRSTHQETHGQFTFIVAGVNPASVVRSHFDGTTNPIFELAMPHYLEALTTPRVRDMVRFIGRHAGLKFDEEVYPTLQNTYGGHPYLIRIACSEVWAEATTNDPERQASITTQDFARLQPKIKARLQQPIKDILLSLVWWYPDEYDLLRILAEGDRTFAAEYLQQNPGSLIQFAKYGILKEGSGAQFAIESLREFLNENGDQYKKELSPFKRGDMPPELLPDVPDLKELGKFFEKRCEIETVLRKAIILYLGVKHTWDPAGLSEAMLKGLGKRPDRRRPADLFVGRDPKVVINDLYLLDLKSIVLANWDSLSPLFAGHKKRFEMNMETINKARKHEAHTKPFTKDEAVDFDNSYGWLLGHLRKIPRNP